MSLTELLSTDQLGSVIKTEILSRVTETELLIDYSSFDFKIRDG